MALPNTAEDRLNSVLLAINREPKALLVAKCLDNSEFKGVRKLGTEYRKWADWPSAEITLGHYCDESISLSGLIYRQNSAKKWRLNEDGVTYGRPIAAAALMRAQEQGFSLYSVFGPTHSTSTTRSPGNVAKLLKSLHSGSTREVELVDFLQVNDFSIREHLMRLRAAGLIEYESVNPEQPGWAQYFWIAGKDPADAPAFEQGKTHLITLTQQVADYLAENGTGSCYEIANALDKSGRTSVSSVLAHLARNGFAESKFGGADQVKSDITLTELGERTVKFVESIEEALDDGPALGRMEAQHRNLDPDSTRYAVELYKQVSPRANGKSQLHWRNAVQNFVGNYFRKHGRGPRFQEIVRSLGSRSVVKEMAALVDKGVLEKDESDLAVRYIPISSAEVE